MMPSRTPRQFPLRMLLALLLAGVAPIANACSLVGPQRFEVSHPRRASAEPIPVPEIKVVGMVPAMGGDTSCSDVGMLSLEVTLKEARPARMRDYGFLVTAVSGTGSEHVFPAHPLAAFTLEGRTAHLGYSWAAIPTDDDGHLRWRLRLQVVSRHGDVGAPVEFCAASDGSCEADLAHGRAD
jgi:hypothetical protein